jgi:hypothetical protein
VAGSPLGLWLRGLAALVLLFVLGFPHPLAYLALGIWLPLPIILVGWRLGSRWAALLTLTAAAGLVAVNPSLSLFRESLGAGQLLLMGLILTLGRNRGWTDGNALVITALIVCLGLVTLLLGQAWWAQVTPLQLWQQKAGELAATLQKLLEESGLGSQSWQPPGLAPVSWQALMIRILPALTVVNIGCVAWFNLVLARRLGEAFGWSPAEPRLSQWRSPEWLIFGFLAAGFSLLAPLPALRLVGLNLALIIGFLYFCQGVAVVAALFQRFQVPLILRGLGYLLMFINPMLLVIALVGLMDLWLDFRQFPRPRESEE